MDRAVIEPEHVGAELERRYPEASCELHARDPWELLVAAILSARASDVQVNKVMAVLTEHFAGPEAIAAIDHRDLQPVLRHVTLYRQKARAIVEAARAIVRLHHGVVPASMADLAALPGVGRKTAAVVLGNAFGIPAIAADTHVQRIVYRLGWTASEHPRHAETALADRFAPHRWVRLCHQLIRLGRDSCKRLNPKCASCPFAPACPKQGVGASR
ncbi:MAG: endonuclease III [Planctomycetes bacterium]|nr:endonuclease III [Planctomycetota bacterium]